MLQELHLGLPGGFEKVINYASHRRIDEIRETWKIRLSTMAAVSGRKHRLVIKNNYIVVIISILLQLELVCIDFLTIEQHKEGHPPLDPPLNTIKLFKEKIFICSVIHCFSVYLVTLTLPTVILIPYNTE